MSNKATLATVLGTALTATTIALQANPVSALTFNIAFDIDTYLLPTSHPDYTPSPDTTPVKATITTTDVLTESAVTPNFFGYLITSITGTQGTHPIISLNSFRSTQIGLFSALNDNLFNPNGSEFPASPLSAFFSQGGLAYTIQEDTGTEPYQAFYDAASNSYMGCLEPCVTISNIGIVPEPTSTLSLLSLGILGAGATLKRKVKRTHFMKKEPANFG